MPPLWNTLEYRLHARVGILHGTRPAVRLWYALRALDTEGTGKVTVPVGEIEQQLGKSRLTVRRYLKDTTFFRSHYVEGGALLTVYLHGLAAVCKALGFTDIGPVGFNEGLGQLQKDAALIGAQSLQQASLYLATRDRDREHDVLDAVNIKTIDGAASFITWGVTDHVMLDDAATQCEGTLTINTVAGRPQRVHVLHEGATLYGASLEGIANLLQVCSKTISRALQGVLRIRQAQQISEWEYQALRAEASESLTGTVDDCPYPFYSRDRVLGPYRLHTYLYYPLYALCSQRRIKSRVNPWLKECAWGAGAALGCT